MPRNTPFSGRTDGRTYLTDPDGDDGDEPWFLSADPLPDRTPPVKPYATAPGAPDLRDWRAAQGDLAADLGQLCTRFGALDERLRRGHAGWRHRLALIEAADLSWWCGDRVPADRLALWVGLRLAGVQADTLALARAAWAVRRLQGGPGPETGLAGFLGRQPGEARLADRIADWDSAMATAEGLHPVVQAALGFTLWPLADVSGDAGGGLIEAAVVAARRGGLAGRGGAVFLPVAMARGSGLQGGGPAADRLARWINGAEQATLAALLHLDRLEAWQSRATTALAGLSGRTPPRLVAIFAAWPFVSAPMAETETGASRAAVQRNLDRMQDFELIREVTGQGRYRLWAARI